MHPYFQTGRRHGRDADVRFDPVRRGQASPTDALASSGGRLDPRLAGSSGVAWSAIITDTRLSRSSATGCCGKTESRFGAGKCLYQPSAAASPTFGLLAGVCAVLVRGAAPSLSPRTGALRAGFSRGGLYSGDLRDANLLVEESPGATGAEMAVLPG